MKIDALNTVPIDPFRMVTAGSESPAIAQAHRNTSSERTQKTLQKEKPSADEIKKDLDVINTQLRSANSSIQFTIDGRANEVVIKIVDDNTGKVIRQIPPDDVIRMREHLKDVSGLLVKEKA